MIHVDCVVKNENKEDNNSKDLVINSVDFDKKRKNIDCVELFIGSAHATVYGPDLIQAIENCLSNTPRGKYRYRGLRNYYHEDSEDEE